jgi:hypothetical protein
MLEHAGLLLAAQSRLLPDDAVLLARLALQTERDLLLANQLRLPDPRRLLRRSDVFGRSVLRGARGRMHHGGRRAVLRARRVRGGPRVLRASARRLRRALRLLLGRVLGRTVRMRKGRRIVCDIGRLLRARDVHLGHVRANQLADREARNVEQKL